MKTAILTLTTLTFVSTLCFASPEPSGRWLDRKSEGYFWYEDPEEVPEPPPAEAPPPPPLAEPSEPPKTPVEAEPVQPAPLSAAWIRANMQKYLDVAIDNPTPENVAAFLYLQRHVMDKASMFMDATEEVTLGRAGLDQIDRRPTSSFASRITDDIAAANHKAVLTKISESAGLFYFSDGSASSSAMDDIIEMKRNSGFDVIRILAPGVTALKPHPDDRLDNGYSDQMGIETFPAVVLISSDGTYDVLSQAAVSLQELDKRIIIGSKRISLISEDEYDSTRPYGRLDHRIANLPNITPQQGAAVPIPADDIIKAFNGGQTQ